MAGWRLYSTGRRGGGEGWEAESEADRDRQGDSRPTRSSKSWMAASKERELHCDGSGLKSSSFSPGQQNKNRFQTGYVLEWRRLRTLYPSLYPIQLKFDWMYSSSLSLFLCVYLYSSFYILHLRSFFACVCVCRPSSPCGGWKRSKKSHGRRGVAWIPSGGLHLSVVEIVVTTWTPKSLRPPAHSLSCRWCIYICIRRSLV